MSIPIWDSGDLVACLCVQRCDRCDNRGSCVQLRTEENQIDICIACFCQLAYSVGKFAGETLREKMGRGLRGEPLVSEAPGATLRELNRADGLISEGERKFLNRTWCEACQSHFCTSPAEHNFPRPPKG